MPQIDTQLLKEATAVGAMTVVLSKAVEALFPKMSPGRRLFLTGLLFHLGAELSGLNDWYVEHSVAAQRHGAVEVERKPTNYIEVETSCHYSPWSDSESDVALCLS